MDVQFWLDRGTLARPVGLAVCPRLVPLGCLHVLACAEKQGENTRLHSLAMLGVVQEEEKWQMECLLVLDKGHPRVSASYLEGLDDP